MSSERVTAGGEHQAEVQRLRERNAELENSNQLLRDELAECRREHAELRGSVESFLDLLRVIGYSREGLKAGKLRRR
jgi:predicted nuclease with TOPRIM domain